MSTMQHAVAEATPGTGQAAMGQEFLTFRLGKEEYGIEILKVQEIRGYDAVTAIANAPAFIKGVINLRGVIVPIVDLRMRFGVDEVTYDAFTVVIILNVARRVVGVVVDSVQDVLSLAPAQMKGAPEFSSSVGAHFISGVGTVDQRMLVLLDIEKLITDPSLALVDEAMH